MNIAVILAGGAGKRLGDSLPKQFLEVAGRKIIEHTIEAFEKNKKIDEIVIVSNPSYIANVQQIIVDNQWNKVKQILNGGKERYDSSLAAITAYKENNDDTNIIFHDAVRPLVSQTIINNCIQALESHQAITVAIPTTDTIIITNKQNTIDKVLDRTILYNVQTPQCFKLGIIKQAYSVALKDPNFETTDDCGVVIKYLPETPIHIVQGDTRNIKITYKTDIQIMEEFCKDI